MIQSFENLTFFDTEGMVCRELISLAIDKVEASNQLSPSIACIILCYQMSMSTCNSMSPYRRMHQRQQTVSSDVEIDQSRNRSLRIVLSTVAIDRSIVAKDISIFEIDQSIFAKSLSKAATNRSVDRCKYSSNRSVDRCKYSSNRSVDR